MAITNIPRSAQYWANVTAGGNDFNLDAGAYGLTVSATAWGTATLQRLYPDTSGTYIPVSAALAANGFTELHLPAGQYRLVLAGVTAFFGMIELIAPGSR